MPYASQAQSRFIHRKAGLGVPWAQKFVADAQHGEGSVRRLPQHAGGHHSPMKRAKHRMGGGY
jgi:hypothetical protein